MEEKDPINRLAAWMEQTSLIHKDERDAMEASIAEEVEQAVQFAEAADWEHEDSLFEHLSLPLPTPLAPPPEVETEATETNLREAFHRGLEEALAHDDRVFLMGEDIGRYGGCYAVTHDLFGQFGAQRVIDTPLAENGFTGAGLGAALGGMRPVVEIMTINFSLLAIDQIVNTAAALLLHIRRPVQCPGGNPHGHRRRPPSGGTAFPQPGKLVHPRARPAGAGAGHGGGRPLHALGGTAGP